MENQPTIYVLSDEELDAVSAAKKAAKAGSTVVDIVEVSIGEVVAVGKSKLKIEIVGVGKG